MNLPIHFSLGLPFGAWQGAVASLVPSLAAGAPQADLLQATVFGQPPLEQWDVARARLALGTAPDPVEVQRMLAGTAHVADDRLCWSAQALAQALPEARFVVWAEHPAHALCTRLSGGAAHVEAAVELLHSAAQCLNQLALRYPDRCLVLLLDDLHQGPIQVRRRLGEWLGRELADPPASLDAALPDPLALALAARAVRAHPGLTREWERLFAACQVLDPASSAWPQDPSGPAPLHQAIARYQQLAGLEGVAAELVAETQNLKTELRRVEQAQRRAQEESTALLAQLHSTQEELEAQLLAEQRTAVQMAELGEEAETLRKDGHAQRTRSADLQKQADLLLLQLHQVQEELEHYFLANEQASAPTVHAGRALTVSFADWDVAGRREQAPHRELSLVLHHVVAGDRTWDRLAVRLVEHHARPGLVLLAPPEGAMPLFNWQPTGREGGQELVLIVPGDEPSQQLLGRLGTSDWQFVVDLAALLATRCAQHPADLPPLWHTVAHRLCAAIGALAPRFRYDTVQVATQSGVPGELVVSFLQVTLAGRWLPQAVLNWRPAAGMLQWRCPEPVEGCCTEPALPAAWPVDENGQWATLWHLPLGNGEHDHEAWRALSRQDRDSVLALVDALPAAAQAAAAAGAATQQPVGELVQQAQRLVLAAHRLAFGSRLRRVWRAVRGRLIG